MIWPTMLALVFPFNLDGPDFLKLFWLLGALAIMAGFVARRYFIGSFQSSEETEEPSPYEVACLVGPTRAVHAAVAQLCQDGLISVDASKWQVSHVAPGEVASRPAIEQAVLRAVAGNADVPFAIVQDACAPALADLQSELRQKDLLLSVENARLARLIPALLVGAVELLGLVRYVIGIIRDKPSWYLFYSWLVLLVVSMAVLGRRPYRTDRGEDLLGKLKVKYADLEPPARPKVEPGTPSPVFAIMAVPLAVGRVRIFRARGHAGGRVVPAHAQQSGWGRRQQYGRRRLERRRRGWRRRRVRRMRRRRRLSHRVG